MSKILKISSVLVLIVLTGVLPSCIRKVDNGSDAVPDENYHVGIWGGNLVSETRLVLLHDESDYWNSFWKVEGVVRLDEYQDGSLNGNARFDFFNWEKIDENILQTSRIKTGQWDVFTSFELELEGEITDTGYSLRFVEIPVSLPHPSIHGTSIDFWDFLLPSLIEGEWTDSEHRTMQGSSTRPQGNDYAETARTAEFREFGVSYVWDIDKL